MSKRTSIPVGDFEYVLPIQPKKEEIDGYGLPKKQQVFTRSYKTPDEFDSMPKDTQIAFIQRELKRREDGYWFYNNGNIEYMTGVHYFYCNWWKIDVGFPRWREADRDFFYIWDLCVKDPNCFGLILMGGRRMGKSYMGTGMLYEYGSKTENTNVGIQSKTRQDAEVLFNKIVLSWKHLPYYLKPTDSGDTNPKKALRFEQPGVRSSNMGGKKIYKKVLNSKIDFEATVETAYDGQKLGRYYLDECGKTVGMNVYDTWNIVKECMALGANIIGKALLTSTVEEMEKKGGYEFKRIWDESDHREKTSVGRTKSGLYRYFRPADHGFEEYIDDYGYSMRQEANEYILKKREGLSGDSLESERRKYPLTESDSFRTSKGDSLFDVNKIYDQIEYNLTLPVQTWVKGDFDRSPIDERVIFRIKENGRFTILRSQIFTDKAIMAEELRFKPPHNPNKYVIGVDPFDHDVTADKKKSDGAAYCFKISNPLDPDSNMIVAEYCNRPERAEIFYDDILNLALYFGCEVLCENQKIGMIQHFKRHGFEKYLMKRPEATHSKWTKEHNLEYGIPNTPPMRDYGLRLLHSYVHDNTGLNDQTGNFGTIYFSDLLHDLIKFETDKWSPYDRSVAFILTLIATLKYEKSFKKEKQLPDPKVQYVRVFNPNKFIGLT